MSNPFAALESSINASVVSRLSNAVMTINSAAVDGILTNEFVTVDYVESRKPVFICKMADVSGVAHGDDVIAADSTAYKVRGIQPDGTGLVKLILELQ